MSCAFRAQQVSSGTGRHQHHTALLGSTAGRQYNRQPEAMAAGRRAPVQQVKLPRVSQAGGCGCTLDQLCKAQGHFTLQQLHQDSLAASNFFGVSKHDALHNVGSMHQLHAPATWALQLTSCCPSSGISLRTAMSLSASMPMTSTGYSMPPLRVTCRQGSCVHLDAQQPGCTMQLEVCQLGLHRPA